MLTDRFPLTDCMFKNDKSMAQPVCDDLQTGPNPFRGSNIGMVSQCPVDYMHLVCLGVFGKMLLLWLGGPLNVRLSANVLNHVSDHMKALQPYIPVEFAQKPWSFRACPHWPFKLYCTQARLGPCSAFLPQDITVQITVSSKILQ